MRLIDADALIEKLDEMQLEAACQHDSEDVGIAKARDVVESFPTALQWISVDERLPEGNETVLARTGQGYVLAWYSLPNQRWHTDGNNLPLADDYIFAWRKIEEYTDDE